MLWKNLHDLVGEVQESPSPGNPFSILFPDQFCNLTWKEIMTWRLEDSNQNTSSPSSTGYQGQTKQESSYESNQNAYQLLAWFQEKHQEGSISIYQAQGQEVL